MIDDVLRQMAVLLRQRQLGETLVWFENFCQNELEIKGS